MSFRKKYDEEKVDEVILALLLSHVYGERYYEGLERPGLGRPEPVTREGSDQRSEEQGQIRNVERRSRERVSPAISEVFCKQ